MSILFVVPDQGADGLPLDRVVCARKGAPKFRRFPGKKGMELVVGEPRQFVGEGVNEMVLQAAKVLIEESLKVVREDVVMGMVPMDRSEVLVERVLVRDVLCWMQELVSQGLERVHDRCVPVD